MELIYKLCAIAAIVSLLTLVLKKHQPELSYALSIVAVLFVIFLGSGVISTVIKLFDTIANRAGVLPEILSPFLKVLAIAILTKISVDMCKESGCLGLAAGIELIGNSVAIVTTAPLILSMLSFLSSI